MKNILYPALAGLALAFTPADTARAASEAVHAAGSVLEIVSFRLVPGTSPDDFLAAAKATEAPLRRQPGYIRRVLVAGPDGTWTDLVEWADMAKAQAAAAAIMQEQACHAFLSMIDMGSVRMEHPAIMWQMD